MDSLRLDEQLLDTEHTQTREALRQIIEVFRTGHQAAADLKHSIDGLTQHQLERELATIEADMLSQISCICETYRLPAATRLTHN